MTEKWNYSVLYTQVLKQWDLKEAIRRSLPGCKGDVFYPCVELWWHGENETKYRPLFPGYVFIRSRMERTEIHELIRKSRKELLSFVKELRLSESRMIGEDGFENSNIFDLTDEEAQFFDFMLGFQYDEGLDLRREEAKKQGKLYIPVMQKTGDAPEISHGRQETKLEEAYRLRQKRLPEKGVIQISFGYKENGRYFVMDGPLKGHEEYIRDYKLKDYKAYLNISLAGHPARAGLILLGKRVWFPDDLDAPDLLTDGTEFDAKRLVRNMTTNGIRGEKKGKTMF